MSRVLGAWLFAHSCRRTTARRIEWSPRTRCLPIRGWAVALLVPLLLAACAPPSGRTTRPSAATATDTPSPAPSPTAGPGTPTSVRGTPLSAFGDWRVSYIGPDSRVHAVSLDGQTDVAGAALALPHGGASAGGLWTAGTSPDGKHLALYMDGFGRVAVLDVVSGASLMVNTIKPEETGILWSPGQRYIALGDAGYVESINTSNGSTLIMPPLKSSNLGPVFLVSQPFGWINATHVAVENIPASTTTMASLQSLDVDTGALHPIATVPAGHVGFFSVEPGGAFTLFASTPYQSDAFTPVAGLINNATGAVTPLPQVTRLMGNVCFSQVLWRPGTSQALVAFSEGPYHLIDVRQDTVAPLAISGLAEAWSPDGRTLIVDRVTQQQMGEELGVNDVGVAGSGPYTLDALTVDDQGNVRNSVELTEHAETIPVLGFVRTA